MAVAARSTIVSRGDRMIAYDVAGVGPLVVFLHGLTSSRMSWDPVTNLLRRDFTCVRIDIAGHGDSSEVADYSMPALVADVHAVVQELGAGMPVLVGNSLGATIAAIYAALHPTEALVLIDQSLRFGDFADLVQRHADELRGPRTLEAVLAIDRELGLGPRVDLEAFERRVLAFSRDVVLGIWAGLLATPPGELNSIAEAIVGRITSPVLSLHGWRIGPEYEGWLKGLVPSAHVEVWDGLGHLLHLVHPERFVARLGSWLSSIRVPDATGNGVSHDRPR